MATYGHTLLLFVFLLIFGAGWAQPPKTQKQADSGPEVINVMPKECITQAGKGPKSGSPVMLRFVNNCQEDVYTKFCVVDRNGNKTRYVSPIRIPRFSTYNLNLAPGEIPSNVTWSSSIGMPPDPAPCGKHQQKRNQY